MWPKCWQRRAMRFFFIRSNFHDSPLGVAQTVTVDLSDGGIARGLLEFDPTGKWRDGRGIPVPASFQVSCRRSRQPSSSLKSVVLAAQIWHTGCSTHWTRPAHGTSKEARTQCCSLRSSLLNAKPLFSMHLGDGIQADDVEASSNPSLQIVAPSSGDVVSVELTDDVVIWLGADTIENQLWCAIHFTFNRSFDQSAPLGLYFRFDWR